MSLTDSLITKYRPNKWDEVIGQAEVVKSLKQVVAQKTSHAFLFVGPSGIGKTTLSRLVANAFKAIPQEIDGAVFSSVESTRELTEGLRYKPLNGRAKAIIIDECQSLSGKAIDSLLKSMEEPPSWIYFFLATTNASKIPQTIKSRCSVYNLKPVPTSELHDYLIEIAAAEKLTIDPGILDLCAKEADGSPRQALSNLAICSVAKTRQEAATLLRAAEQSDDALRLAQALAQGPVDWDKLKPILTGLKDQNPESIRHMIRGYFIKIALNSNNKTAPRALAVLDAFSVPFNSQDGIAPVLLAVGRLVFP